LDNLLASMKAGLDGLADALGVDDSRWRLLIEMGEPVKGGCVCVKVGAV
jgi:crossover junction endodeoxyribonuclease RusA